jgi:ADP-heptose:LPS heptosyltransferase
MSERRLSTAPRRVLMLKGHSAGVGDLLRSSAAWRALRDAWPAATLHLLFLTRDPGAAAEELIRQHHLLRGFDVVDKRTRTLADGRRFLREVRAAADRVRPDLVIDFEPNGLRTSWLTAWLGWRHGAKTVGIATQPGRGWFYQFAAVSPPKFALARRLSWPLEYTNRDFVALSALGLERAGRAIELQETEAARAFRRALRARHGLPEDAPLLGLNIGCGTPDAVSKRPNLRLLSELVAGLQRARGLALVLTGAPFERAINAEFLQQHGARGGTPVMDLAGQTSLLELVGAINACALFISSDSGPFHMAVALRVPTLAVFNWDNSTHFHHDPWVRCRVAPSLDALPALREAARELLALNPREPVPADAPGG